MDSASAFLREKATAVILPEIWRKSLSCLTVKIPLSSFMRTLTSFVGAVREISTDAAKASQKFGTTIMLSLIFAD